MTDVIEKIVSKLNEQKGELLGVHAMLAAVARSLPQSQLAVLLEEFDTEIAVARSTLAYSPVPEEVISGLENYVQMWNAIRIEPNHD
ncbi:hypothetical protein [Pseudomonas aeruginosa]|uniref:hypothetical protein n=1 Tax=Pseudomonas aeruginosa TaxID=287 RepID=UPI00071BA974|nr:hypothetical protein [Pseudomonas aeruginosa]ELK6186227.1 hypothetical protein [Pseudomonas aeruginosa]MBG4558055.1 hypothetical protein [Pseudomonas aeruginosa]MBG6691325.1 hypothetical protein [Pseudomonas aeruginosa]MBG6727638.1 hypothetical protein [Pseudomonas aeruginosa]MBG7133967.1 hypothetical protein [Pseudomonas aeruginosa]